MYWVNPISGHKHKVISHKWALCYRVNEGAGSGWCPYSDKLYDTREALCADYQNSYPDYPNGVRVDAKRVAVCEREDGTWYAPGPQSGKTFVA